MSSSIKLRADGPCFRPCDTVLSTAPGSDGASFAEPLKDRKGALRQGTPVRCGAGQVAYFAALAPNMVDCAATGAFMQHTQSML